MSKITRDDIDTYVANIVATWQRATADQLSNGRAWYNVARDLALVVGNGDVRMGAGIIAALSPNTAWYLNVRQAHQVRNGETFGTLPGNLANVARILSGEDFATVLPKGKKTWHFAYNIIGDSDHVTIDRWAIRIALGTPKKSVTPLQYDVLADAYRKAAAEIGEPPSTVQAVTWCVQRGTGE